jgi:PKD repeat protein
VSLTVTDDLGVSTTTTVQVTVDAPPTASFTAPLTPLTPESPATFDASASSDAVGTITGYSWDFGDGSSGTGVSPAHVFTSSGTYTVVLTVTNNAGQTATASHVVTVDAPPTASFTAPSTPLTPGSPATFDASSSSDTVGTITGYRWDFGDGSSGTGVNATHVFTSSGTYTVVLTVTNNAGQTATASHVVTVDTQAPAAPAITSPADHSYDNSHTVVLSGTAEPNSTIVVYDGSASVGGASTNGAGNWTSTLTSVADGAHAYTATATDAAGNTSPASAQLHITVDTQAPAAPAITSPADHSYNNTHTVVVSGTAEVSSTLSVLDGSSLVATVTADGSGNWSTTISGAGDGTHTYSATATDAAKNTSVASTAVHATVDTQPPGAPAITSPADHSYHYSHSVALSGTAEPNSTMVVYDGSASVGGASTNGAGNWTSTLTSVADGAHAYTATATDAAGNTSVASTPVQVTVDDIPPVTSITSGTTSTGDVGFSFASSEAGSTFECKLTGPNQPGAFTPCPSPIAYHNLATGSYTFSVRATDRTGNIDPTPPTWSFTVQPPAAGGGASSGGGPAGGDGTEAPVPPTSPSTGTTGGIQSPVPNPPSTSAQPSRVGSLKLAPSRFAAASSRPSATARVSAGSTITFKLTDSGPVYFHIQVAIPGREVHGQCITGSRTSHGARCTQLKNLAGSFRWNGHTGLNRFHFSARLDGIKLKTGSYRLIAISSTGQSLSIPFTIID